MSCGFCCFFQLYRRTISSFTWDRLFTNQVLDINYWFCPVCWFLVKIPKFNTGFNNHVLATFAQPDHRQGQLGRVDWETGCGIVMRGLKDLGWLCGLGEALGVTEYMFFRFIWRFATGQTVTLPDFFFWISCWIKYLLIIQVIPSKNYRPVHFLGIKLTHNFLPVPKKKKLTRNFATRHYGTTTMSN